MAEGRRLYPTGEILSESAAHLSPCDRGCLCGDGVFEVTPCFDVRASRGA